MKLLKFHLLIQEQSVTTFDSEGIIAFCPEYLGLCWSKYNEQDHPQLAKGRASPSVLPSVTFFHSITKCLRVRLPKGLRWNGI